MNINLDAQLEIIEQEKLVSCKADLPVMTSYEKKTSVILDSQDLHILCKLARSNNVEVILYSEKKLDDELYYIDKEILQDDDEEIFSLMESDIDEYNKKCQQLDFDSAIGCVFFFVAYGKYYIQEIEYSTNQEISVLPSQQQLKEIMEFWKPEMERIRENAKQEREEALNEFLEYVKQDPQFIVLGCKDYARYVFISNNELEKYRTLFYSEDDIRCESQVGARKCYQELEKLNVKMQKDRQDYRKTEEYAKRMSEFEEFVRKDASFWQFDFPGHRRDYSYQVFLTNPQAEKYRTLFYAESDVECKEYDARRDCFYQLERIYNEGKEKKVKKPKFFG